jgi:hypothetical protein
MKFIKRIQKVKGSSLITVFLVIMSLNIVSAHHGWSYFDTSRPFYLSGTITEVRWQNPHVEIVLEIPDGVSIPEGFTEREFPQPLLELGLQEELANLALPENTSGSWTLVLAPISRLTRWGMPEAPQVGETLEAVGFLSCDEPNVMRPQLTVEADGAMAYHQSVELPSGCES